MAELGIGNWELGIGNWEFGIKIPHSAFRIPNLLKILFVLGLGWICLAPSRALAGHGGGGKKPAASAEKKESESAAKGESSAGGKKEGKTSGEVPKYRLGRPLNGYFDLKTLRSATRVSGYRYPLGELKHTIQRNYVWQLLISCSVEFGSESGLAEMAENNLPIRDEIHRILDRGEPLELLQASGKRRLKEEIIAAINRHLATAQVRQLYWTEFQIGR